MKACSKSVRFTTSSLSATQASSERRQARSSFNSCTALAMKSRQEASKDPSGPRTKSQQPPAAASTCMHGYAQHEQLLGSLECNAGSGAQLMCQARPGMLGHLLQGETDSNAVLVRSAVCVRSGLGMSYPATSGDYCGDAQVSRHSRHNWGPCCAHHCFAVGVVVTVLFGCLGGGEPKHPCTHIQWL